MVIRDIWAASVIFTIKGQEGPSGNHLRADIVKYPMFVNGCAVKTKLCFSDIDNGIRVAVGVAGVR